MLDEPDTLALNCIVWLTGTEPLAGKTLKYFHTDSWEVEAINWTPTLRAEFKKRCGYDLIPFLPVIAGRIVDSLESYRRYYRGTRGAVWERLALIKAWPIAGHKALGKRFVVRTGAFGDARLWDEIRGDCHGAVAARAFRSLNFGVIGNTYTHMTDMPTVPVATKNR